MKKLKLNLDELSRELEILDIDYLKGIKGGYGTPDGGYGDYGSFGGYGTPDNPIELEPVEIYGNYGGGGSNPGTPWFPWFPPYDPGGNGNYLPGMGGGEGGYGGYGGGEASNSIFGATIPDSQIYQALSFANSSMGLALSQAEASALALKVNLPQGITRLSGGLTALAMIDNGYQYLQGGDWQDGVQAFLGLAATTAAIVPGGQGVAFVLGSVLFVWELAE